MMLRPLRPGDRIALVAPSSPFETDRFQAASRLLESKGYRLAPGRHIFARRGYLAGSDAERAEDLIEALCDSSVAAVLCIRGGYGASRLLTRLPFASLARHPKILLGYSDVTFLHMAFWSRMGWVTFHGPNLLNMAELAMGAPDPLEPLHGAHGFHWQFDAARVLHPGRAAGRLLGGNLTCILHLVGTPFFADLRGSLLLIEDVTEPLYRLDRLLNHLKLAGVLGGLAGLVLGRFTDCGDGQKILEMVREHMGEYAVPIVCDLPFGHGPENDIVPLGVRCSLDTAEGTLRVLENPFSERAVRPAPSPTPPLPAQLDNLMAGALEEKVFTAASLLVARPDRVVVERQWGVTKEGGAPADADTLFDLASLTKALVTAPLYMRLVSEGRLALDDPLPRLLPDAQVPHEKRGITLRHLLSHCSGLAPYEPFYRELIELPQEQRRSALTARLLAAPLLAPPGRECHYSDLGFLLLGLALEKLAARPLDALALELLATECLPSPPSYRPPLTLLPGYRPLAAPCDPAAPPRFESPEQSGDFAATGYCAWRRRMLEGEVHDENAYALGAVAPHAGLFGTARSVYRVLASLWSAWRAEASSSSWAPEVVRVFWSRQEMVAESSWALGFDTPSAEHSSAGEHFSAHSVGHLGFTGTSFWMDLDRELLVIFLTNRVYPSRENEKLRGLRPALHNLVMESLHAG